jgi:type IV pilus assembly protein PilQ
MMISKKTESLILTIEGNRALTYTAEKLVFPMGVMLQFPDTSLELPRRIYLPPDNEIISSIKAIEKIEDQTTSARIFIAFKKDTSYDLSSDAGRLTVTFPATGALSDDAQPQSKLVEKEPEPEPENKSFILDRPPRIVFDLYNLKSPYKKEQRVSVTSPWVKRIRHFAHPDRVRLVLETHKNYLSKYSALPNDTGLLIHVGNTYTAPNKASQTASDATSGTQQVKLAWEEVPNATAYNVYWRSSPGVTKHNGNKISNVQSPAVIKNLRSGVTYYFVVTTVKGSKESPESEEFSYTPGE